jgi:UDP-N-acetylmuramoyl-L-alanyl-D-glutamate--2,6-diaminopimelate ligase
MVAEGATPRFVELDRKRAIEETLSQAQSGDTVLIAGKGHEDYQIIGTVKRPFSDSQVVRDYFASLQGA